MTSDPARRQPIRAQVVSKPKISTSAKVKMEGSRAEREGGSPPGNAWRPALEGQAAEPTAGAEGATREGVPAEGGRSATTRSDPEVPLGTPHFDSCLCTPARGHIPGPGDTAPPGLALGVRRDGDGGRRLGMKVGKTLSRPVAWVQQLFRCGM